MAKSKISLPAHLVAIYFILMPFDLFPIFGLGTLLKYYAFIPILAIFIFNLKSSLRLDAPVVLMLAFLCFSFFSLFYTISLSASLSSLKALVPNILFIFFVGAVQQYNEAEYVYLKKALVIGGYLVILFTLLNADYSTAGRLSFSLDGEGGADQNYLNGYLFFPLVFHLNQMLESKHRLRLLHFLPVIGIFGFTVMTGSRGGLLAELVIIVCCFLRYLYHHRKAIWVYFVVIFAAIGGIIVFNVLLRVLPAEVTQRFSTEYISENGSTGRADIWVYLLNRFADDTVFYQLFGHGAGTTPVYNTMNGLVAHNIFIDNLIQIGILGLLIYTGMTVSFIYKAGKFNDGFLFPICIGYVVMCMSLSLNSYKPMWNIFIMILIQSRIQYRKAQKVVERGTKPKCLLEN